VLRAPADELGVGWPGPQVIDQARSSRWSSWRTAAKVPCRWDLQVRRRPIPGQLQKRVGAAEAAP